MLFCAGQTWRGFTEEISIMFTTAKEIWGLPGRHWFVGWDTPASLQLTSALVHLPSVLHFLFFVLFYHLMNAAITAMAMLRVSCLFTVLFVGQNASLYQLMNSSRTKICQAFMCDSRKDTCHVTKYMRFQREELVPDPPPPLEVEEMSGCRVG